MAAKSKREESISNLSNDLITHALELIQRTAFPAYKRNIDTRDPPFAHNEFAPCAIGTLLLTSGLDYHLARLKYLRDAAQPPLPHTPYFNWGSEDSLSFKVEQLLIKRTEKRLKEQLIELTIMRDSVAHPKLYVITQLMNPDYSYTKQRAKLSEGGKHRPKARERKLKNIERTRSLHLPLVPTWISYVEAVICILVMNRFLNLLEEKYGSYYALQGRYFAKNEPVGFFATWEGKDRHLIAMEDWARAFFDSLAHRDQAAVEKRLGCKDSKYIAKRLLPWEIPDKPAFLSQAPPWLGIKKLQTI